MGLYTVLAMAFALSADAFSFSIGLGMSGITRQQIFLLSLTVLIFHIFMPLLGYYVGGFFGALLGKYAGIVGALILIFLGLRMAWEGLSDKEERITGQVLTSMYGIVVIATTVSLDALSVGITLGTQKVALGVAACVIGVIAGVMTFVGLGFGRKIGEWIGHRATILGGIVLIYIGVNLFL